MKVKKQATKKETLEQRLKNLEDKVKSTDELVISMAKVLARLAIKELIRGR